MICINAESQSSDSMVFYNESGYNTMPVDCNMILQTVWLLQRQYIDQEPSKVWDETAYPFPNFNAAIVEV